ncbi:arginine-glutamic acid dipeptide repeats protein isoform X2 [Rhipicephalus sanguineus]|uniref:arginine-glutamic acid dipeptide repeats protein isoform X2 n=1 Tax=Rhipicephalus sanguineus TaxID=34632 RepID=UPI0018959F14|nr:arginine-glutamic acid dipeptide repeats protein isoform X2 [Rhipicephalus sanguineus]
MEFEYSVISQPPVDDSPTCIPLPCYGRGLPLTPLAELPIYQYLKKQHEEELLQSGRANEVPSGIGRGRISTLSSGFSVEDSSDAGDNDVVGSYWRNQVPLRVSSLNAGLEPLSPAAPGLNETVCRPPGSAPPSARCRGRGTRTPGKRPTSKGPATAIGGSVTASSTLPQLPPSLPVVSASSRVLQSAQDTNNATRQPGPSRPSSVPSRSRGIADPWKLRIQQMVKQPGRSQPSNCGTRPRCPRAMSGPPPASSHQLETALSSQQPPLSKPHQEPSLPPRKSIPRGAGRQEKGQSQCSTRRPIRKGSFDPNTFSHALDLSSWAESLSSMQPRKQTTESGTELTDSEDDNFHRRVPLDQDSVYESCSSSSGSSTDLVYESAVEVTPLTATPVSGGATPVAGAVSPVLDSCTVLPDSATVVPDAAIGVPDAVIPVSKIAATVSEKQKQKLTPSKGTKVLIRVVPDASNSVLEKPKKISSRGTEVLIQVLPKAVPDALTAPSTIAAEKGASASAHEEQDMASLRGTRVLIKGLPKATTREFVYYNTASFASIDDVIIASDEDGASAEIILTKPYSATKLCQCLQSALTLEGRSNRLEFSCLKPA